MHARVPVAGNSIPRRASAVPGAGGASGLRAWGPHGALSRDGGGVTLGTISFRDNGVGAYESS